MRRIPEEVRETKEKNELAAAGGKRYSLAKKSFEASPLWRLNR